MSTAISNLQIDNLYCHMGSSPLFSNLNASLNGPVVALLGRNGSGKTTLLRMMAGIHQPDGGSILFRQLDIYARPISFKKVLGYVPSTPFLYPHLTVYENLLLSGKLHGATASDIHDLMDRFALHSFRNRLYGQLSTGWQKKAGIASQLAHNPQLLILDEPCSDLDPEARQQLWDLIRELRSSRMIVFSSHHPEEIRTFTDEWVLLQEGRLEILKDGGFTHTLWTGANDQPRRVEEVG